MSIGTTLGLFFSEKFLGNGKIRGHRADFDVKP